MTWSLSYGLMKSGNISSKPTNQQLEIAKNTLLRFDFVMDLTSNAVCSSLILKLMGLGYSSLEQRNAKKGDAFEPWLDRQQYEELNSLDVELYHFAKILMQIDCDLVLKLSFES